LPAFLDDGAYTVTLTVTDDDSSMDAITHTVTIMNVAPTVSISLDSVPYVGRPVSFTGSFEDPGALDPHTYTWNFGDGTPVVTGTLTPEHIFGAVGTFEVALTVTDDDASTTAKLQLRSSPLAFKSISSQAATPTALTSNLKGWCRWRC
jgi:PKD repeat protein